MPLEASASPDTITIDIDCPPAVAEYLGQLLWGIEGVQSVEERYSNPNAAEVTLDDLDVLRVFASTNSPEIIETLHLLLASDTALNNCRITAQATLKEEDWAEHWKQYWHATRISKRLTICPSWERTDYVAAPEEIVIELDPGSAFGTGAHPTTCLTLKAIEQLALEVDFTQLSILDIGTGSGVLAIAASKLGCQNITAIDICPHSIEATKANATINLAERFITASTTPLAELCQTQHNIILANIIAPVILSLLPDILIRLAPDGVLVLSGLIQKNLPEIEEALTRNGLSNIQQQQEGDWYVIIARR